MTLEIQNSDPTPRSDTSEVIEVNGALRAMLRIPIFRLALMEHWVSCRIMNIGRAFSQRTLCPIPFDSQRAELSLQRFLSLGAQQHFVIPRDGQGKIHMMTFCARDLENKIKELGGAWERLDIAKHGENPQIVLAITPPHDHLSNQLWIELEEKILSFGWKKRENLIITCEDADLISEKDYFRYCFLYTHSTSSSFTSDWKRAGFYLGAKQDLCFFNNGNIWKSSGRPSPSEETFYLDIEAVYNRIKDNYSPQNIWVGGSCGGAPVAGYLKMLLHEEGVNFFAEQTFPHLRDFVSHPLVPQFFSSRVPSCLNSRELPLDMPNRPPACQFSVENLWKNLERYEGEGGKFILVEVNHDEHIPSEAYARYLKTARRINDKVFLIQFDSQADWHHADDFFHYPCPRRKFFQAVFQNDDDS